MRFLSIATLILLVDLSVSLRIHDNYNIFRNGGRRPILNSNFGMTCQLYSVYNVNQILDFTRTAHQIIEDPNQGLDTCTFDPFPQEVLYIYRIGTTYLEDTGHAVNYIIVNFVGQFFAGFYQYESSEGTVTGLCTFDWGTQFNSFEGN
ncbi:unnamed protein product [Blumeria hordei]|uniref:Uncharacterized protein n=1 Tax=Blumeria hordei TaxID=2867405 RepID=A0A383UR38_BLUHO|nr:unnamed protein product [Blumeria hordei]